MATEPNSPDVQMQARVSDCGVFALAFATAICFGHSPGKFHFNQRQMRTHLIECLEKSHFSMFPIRKERRQGSKVKASETVPIHCINLPNARSKAGIDDTVQSLQTLVSWQTLREDIRK